MRLDAYYYSFEPTGVEAIDRILSAIACAGKAYHLTEDWQEQVDPYEPFLRGATPVEWIQNAAADAAAELGSGRTLADATNDPASSDLSSLRKGAEVGLRLPDEMTPAIEDALSIMLWTSGSLSRAYRAAGFKIEPKAEKEQAFVLWRTLRHAIQHGDDWRAAAQEELNTLRAALVSGSREEHRS